MREKCAQVAKTLDRSRPQTKDEMERAARKLLADIGEPEGYLGWTMVVLASEFWRDQRFRTAKGEEVQLTKLFFRQRLRTQARM